MSNSLVARTNDSATNVRPTRPGLAGRSNRLPCVVDRLDSAAAAQDASSARRRTKRCAWREGHQGSARQAPLLPQRVQGVIALAYLNHRPVDQAATGPSRAECEAQGRRRSSWNRKGVPESWIKGSSSPRAYAPLAGHVTPVFPGACSRPSAGTAHAPDIRRVEAVRPIRNAQDVPIPARALAFHVSVHRTVLGSQDIGPRRRGRARVGQGDLLA